ncbi:hypothetical protein JZ751_020470 [Albula glossodonta]|uniref:Ig-like domain-containing protein n=1 Tax=Albula glossodonta TaxID=121402 RepID=A0A8T2PNJ4_9TELE|nr:hypothetical protein JZ751_020470 [Albula glossodonta]
MRDKEGGDWKTFNLNKKSVENTCPLEWKKMTSFVFFQCLSLLIPCAVGQAGVEVTQIPAVLMLKPGQSAGINCTQSTSNTYMYWYQQKNSGPLQFLFSTANSDEVTERGDEVPARFTVSRKSMEKTDLQISGVEAEDTAVYYCAASPQ